jgi:hypothetical protein
MVNESNEFANMWLLSRFKNNECVGTETVLSSSSALLSPLKYM